MAAKKKTKHLGKTETGSGGRSMAGDPPPKQEGTAGKSMVKQDSGSSVGGATTRRADPKLKANNASGGAYRSQNNPSGGSGGANRAMNPGLLDGDSGFAAAGPAGTGSGSGGSGAAGGGGSAGGGIARTYGASPNMGSFAPRGGGLPAGSNSGTR
jgi:hypothetical protein